TAARSALEQLWPLAFPGVKYDRGVVDLIDADIEDGNIVKILIASIHAADQECDDFRKPGNSLKYIDKILKKSRFPPKSLLRSVLIPIYFPTFLDIVEKLDILGIWSNVF
ncbi:DNA-directed RNA polymerases IV and V subunit 2-like protein, partial [Tanacetum coccineum]